MKQKPWLTSLTVTAMAVAVSVWLWFGPWLWPGIPWLVMGALPFLVGLFTPRLPLVFGVLPFLVPYVAEGDVYAGPLLFGIGASYMATALGILIRRLLGGVWF